MDTEHRDMPICPHCGHQHSDAWEWEFGPGLEGETDMDCGMCDKPFFVARYATITYTTRPLIRQNVPAMAAPPSTPQDDAQK